jgi:two-component system NarL family sensor kinase
MWAVKVVSRAGIAVGALASAVALVVVTVYDHEFLPIVIALETVPMLPLAIVGASVVRTAPRNVVGWTLVAGGACMPVGVASYLYARAAFDLHHALPGAAFAGWLDGWPWVPGQLAVALFAPLLFPEGRLPSKRWRVVVVIDAGICVLLMYSTIFDPHLLDWPHRHNLTGVGGPAGSLAHGLAAVIGLVPVMTLVGAIAFEVGQRATTNPTIRAAARQVRPAVWVLTASWCLCLVISMSGASTLDALPFESLGMVAVGVTCWVAIRRYGLFDARLVIRRGLVYGALSLCILLVYGVVALVLEKFGAAHATGPVALVVAVLVAVPLRDALQHLANRLLFGLRDDPVATLLSLGDQLERSAAADEVLPAAARSLQRTLRLEHVAILDGGDLAAQAGRPGDGQRIELPLVYAGETVGLLVATQARGDTPMDAERGALLSSIARPIAAALRATALSRDLAASHERLVSATEEERRRLRRDLHDGLGPVLSSAVLGVARANALLVARPDDAARQLETLTRQLQEAVADVRRLVYDLRPPALDHLGLVGALDEQARALGHFTVSGPMSMPPLSAAAEVAAYRIVMEAMTNALRHSQGTSGQVEMTYDAGLRIVVTDDGAGIPDGFRAGVGITSMRERATALGGTCVVEPGADRGTVVSAWLPA